MLKYFLVLTIAIAAVAGWYLWPSPTATPSMVGPQETVVKERVVTTDTSPVVTEPAPMSETKTYRNEEFGFEFVYPAGWIIEEHAKQNPFVILSVTAKPESWRKFFSPFQVIIGTHEHAENFVSTANNIAPPEVLTIDSKTATKYEHLGETYYTTYLVSFDEYVIFIGNENNELVPEFNSILADFKFLR